MNRTSRLIIAVAVILTAAGIFTWGFRGHAVIAEQRPWYVWMKTSPCSGRTDWVSVAQDNPTGGGNSFQYFPGSHSWPTFAAAMAEAATLRTSPLFASYCCRENSVWRNMQTGAYSVVTSKFGNPGIGWQFVKGDLCCDEAFAMAGIAGSCGDTAKNGNTGSCFASDPGAASMNRNDHVNWAQKQDPAALAGNLKNKIDLLFACPSVTDDQFRQAFADYSVIIAKYVQQASCFGGDAGAIVIDRPAHLAWARTRTRSQILANLEQKMAGAFNCLSPVGRVNLFADSSVATAYAPIRKSIPQPVGQPAPAPRPPATTSGLPANWAGTWTNGSGSTITIAGGAGGLSATEVWSGGGRNGHNTWSNCKVNGNTATCNWTGTYENDPAKHGNRHGTLTVTISGNSINGTYYEQKPDFVNADGTPFTGWSAMHDGATWPINIRRQ